MVKEYVLTLESRAFSRTVSFGTSLTARSEEERERWRKEGQGRKGEEREDKIEGGHDGMEQRRNGKMREKRNEKRGKR